MASQTILRYLRLLLIAVTFSFFYITTAQATHFRFGHLTWTPQPDISPTTVKFNLTASFRRNGYPGSGSDGLPVIGDIITETIGGTGIDFGDGTSTGTLQFQVTAYSVTENWINAVALDPGGGTPIIEAGLVSTSAAGDVGVVHTYPSATNPGTIISITPLPGTGLAVPEVEPNNDSATSQAINLGDDFTGDISPSGDADTVAFTVTAGTTIVATTVIGVDTTLTLLNTDGSTQLAFNDDYSGLASRIQYSFPVAGTYYLQVRGYGSNVGSYTLQLREADAVVSPPSPWTAAIQSCCRTSFEINNPDGNYRVQTLVETASGNASPVSSLVPIVGCPVGQICNFTVPANDSSTNSYLTWRMSTSTEAGPGFSQPTGISIDPNTGLITWDSGAIGASLGQLYSTQVTIEERHLETDELITSVAIDFLIRISEGGPPPVCSIDPATSYIVDVGEPLSFSVTGTTPNTNETVTLNSGGLPPGATMTPSLPADSGLTQSITSDFNWTPSIVDVGAHAVTFSATDTQGQQSLCSVNITVPPYDIIPGITRTGRRDFTWLLRRPTPDTTGARCVETADPNNPDFGTLPFIPFIGDELEIQIDLIGDYGDIDVCCQFQQADGSISPAMCKIIELVPLEPPTDLLGRAKPGKTDLTWTPAVDADAYEAFRSDTPGGPYTSLGTTTTNVFVDWNATPGATFYYVVQSIAGDINSSDSAEVEVVVPLESVRRR
jgi:hypothetical protein